MKDLDAYFPLYDRYKQNFEYLNSGSNPEVYAYNGGLFKEDEILDHIKIDDKILYEHTYKLSQYDFASEVDVNILGHIFENSLNEIDEIKAELEGQEIDKSKSKRKKDGVFYTPKYITKYIVENTVGKLCEEKKTEFEIVEEEYSSDKKRQQKTLKNLLNKLDDYRAWLLQITIVDPACGSGAFLNEALNFLIKEHQYIDELEAKLRNVPIIFSYHSESILEHNLFGVDLNEESVEIAKLSLWLRTAERNRKLNSLNNNIKCGNSLIDDPAVAGEKAFNWNEEFPQVFAKGGFDVVIGNPPYGASFNEIHKKFIADKFKTYQYKFESYLYFYEKGIEILRENGMLSYITPELFLRLDKSFNSRKFLLEHSNILELNFWGEDVFQDVKVNSVVLTLRKDNSSLPINILQKDIKVNQISKDRWRSTDNLLIEFEISDEINFIVDKILNGSLLLDEIGECIQGLTPYDSYRGQSQEVIKNRLYHVKSKTDETCGRWLDGKFLNRYQLTYGDEWLKYGSWLAAPREARFFNGARLLFREIPGSGKRIQAVFTDQESYYGHSITPFLNKSQQFDILFILSVANSNLISWFATKKCSNFSKSIFPKLNPKDIKQLPIRNIDSECQKPFIEKADQMLSLNKMLQEISAKFQRTCERKFENLNLTKKLQDWYNLSYADFIKELSKQKIKLSLSEEAEWAEYFDQEKSKALEIQSKIASTDKEIDQMVYELYGLSEEEIGIVENK